MKSDKRSLEELCNAVINKRNVPKKEEWGKDLYQFLFENKDAFLTVIQPGGNNGDELIYKGLNKKLKDIKIEYKEIKYRESKLSRRISRINEKVGTNLREVSISKKTDLILIHGGANINDYWGQGTRLLKNLILHYNVPIAVAPQTFYFTKTNISEIIKKAKQDIHLFCREETSYSSLGRMQLPDNVKIYLSDDTAFYLSKGDFAHLNGCNDKKDYALLCFRDDKESKVSSDVNETFKEIFMDRGIEIINEGDISVNQSFEDFVKIIAGAKIVVADRLHVGVLSSILEKPTLILPNSYFKNKAIYEYSLKYYPATIFVGWCKNET